MSAFKPAGRAQGNPRRLLPRGDEEEMLRQDRTGVIRGREKPLASPTVTVPQTDTGRWAEDAKARERTLVKELGKMAP